VEFTPVGGGLEVTEELEMVTLGRMTAPEAPLNFGFTPGVMVLMVDARRFKAGTATIGAGAASTKLAMDATKEMSVNWKRILNDLLEK